LPSISGQVFQAIRSGTMLTVVSGPFAQDGYYWWQVRNNGVVGFAATGPWLVATK
jgi:hypothetical protein